MDYRLIVRLCHLLCKAYMGQFSEKFPGTEKLIDCQIYCHRLAVVYCAAFPTNAPSDVLDLWEQKVGRTGILAIFLAEK